LFLDRLFEVADRQPIGVRRRNHRFRGIVMAKTTKSRRGGAPAPPIAKPKPRVPKPGKTELPAALPAAEKDIGAKDAFENAKAAASDLFRRTCTAAERGVTNYGLKAVEIARTNTDAAFDYAFELTRVKSLSELIDLSSAHARKQFDAMIVQTRELAELAREVTTEIAEPLKGGTGAKSTQDKRRSPNGNRIAGLKPREEVLLLHVLE